MVKKLTSQQFESFNRAEMPSIGTLVFDEKEWYASDDDIILGVVVFDKSDKDWAYVILEPDNEGMFRYSDGEHSMNSLVEARDKLLARI